MFSEAQVQGVEKIGEHDAYLVSEARGKPLLKLYLTRNLDCS